MPNMTVTLVGDVICQLSSFKCSTMYIQNGHMIGPKFNMAYGWVPKANENRNTLCSCTHMHATFMPIMNRVVL